MDKSEIKNYLVQLLIMIQFKFDFGRPTHSEPCDFSSEAISWTVIHNLNTKSISCCGDAFHDLFCSHL